MRTSARTRHVDEQERAAELAKLTTDPRAGTYFQVLVRVGTYIHAMSALLEASLEDESFSYEQVFYTESLYRMLADWLTTPEGSARPPLEDALSVLGLEHLAQPLLELVAAPVGETTCGAVVRALRDALSTVEAFAGNLPEQIARTFSISQQDMGEALSSLLDAAFEEMLDLQGTVERYFEDEYRTLYELIRDGQLFFSVLHHPWQPQASEG